jgi:hypothetical protein
VKIYTFILAKSKKREVNRGKKEIQGKVERTNKERKE